MIEVPKWRWIVVYVLIGVLSVVWTAAPFAGYFAYEHLKSTSVTKADLGPTAPAELVKLAEKTLASSAQQQGLTVTGMKLLRVEKPNDYSLVLIIRVSTAEVGDVTLGVTFSKGIYSISNVAQVSA